MITNKLIHEIAGSSVPQGLQHEVAQMSEWETAHKAADRIEQMLAGEIPLNIAGNKLQNMYSPFAWIRLRHAVSTLTKGMLCVRMTVEGKSNQEIETATGLCGGSIASYRGWNSVYGYQVGKMLAEEAPEQRNRNLRSLFSMGVTLD